MGRTATGFLAGTALLALLPLSSGHAADLPVKAPPPVVPAFVDWSGVYVGAHVGYGGGMKDWTGADFDFPARGFLGGAQVGINKQIGSFVFGLEVDGSWADISRSQTNVLTGSLFPGTAILSANSKIDGMVTFAGRAGLAADRWFVFAKGGLAGVWEKHALSENITEIIPPFSVATSAGASEFRLAPMIGFGAEYALTGNWSLKAEYDYLMLGSRTVRLTGTETLGGVTGQALFDQPISQDSIHVVKIGANYRWGGLAVDPVYSPVPAAPGTNWTGAFVGVQGGYGFGRSEWPDFFGSSGFGAGNFDNKGWLAGFDGGVNVQSGKFVFGVEGEWMWTGIKGNQTIAVATPGETGSTIMSSSIDWLAIASARAGFVATDRLLVYGKGGIAIANESHSAATAVTFAAPGSGFIGVDAKSVHTGLVGGVGAEYALDGNWSIKGEYDYIHMFGQNFTGSIFESINAPPTVGQASGLAGFDKLNQTLNLLKVGVNYRFNPLPGAVTARY